MKAAIAAAMTLALAQMAARPPEVPVPGTDIAVRRGWRVAFADGCRWAAPADWRVDGGGAVSSPVGARLLVASVPVASWTAHKAQARAALDRGAIVHEDSERRLWIESRRDRWIEHYVAVNGGARACVGVLDLPATVNEAGDLATAIARSIDAAAGAATRVPR